MIDLIDDRVREVNAQCEYTRWYKYNQLTPLGVFLLAKREHLPIAGSVTNYRRELCETRMRQLQGLLMWASALQ